MAGTVPDKECPTPTKSRYATQEMADRAAHYIMFKPDGLNLRSYLCDCGWYHLTKALSAVERAPELPVPEEGDVAWVLAMSEEDFGELVRKDIHRTAPVHYSAALRHLAVVARWEHHLRMEARVVNAQLEARSGKKDLATVEWRARVGVFQTALRTRKEEAKALLLQIDTRTFANVDLGTGASYDRLTQAELRAIAGERALRQLVKDQYPAFTQLLLNEYATVGAEVPARIARYAEQHGLEIPDTCVVQAEKTEEQEAA